jgi:Fe-S-cluster containining protein
MLETSGRKPFYAHGLRFSCVRCSACCRYESGYVFLSEKDAALLRAALNMEYKEFTETYCRWIPSVNGTYQLSLKEKTGYDCIFWASEPSDTPEGGCSVYEARPLQCRAFPFWPSVLSSGESWKITAKDCPGMGRGDLNSRDSIEKWLALRQKEPIISKGVS